MQAEVDSDKATPVSPCGWEDDFIEREVLTGEHINLEPGNVHASIRPLMPPLALQPVLVIILSAVRASLLACPELPM